MVGDFECASQLQTVVDGLGLKACACIATALLRGSMQCWENARSDDAWDASQLWLELHQKTAYVSQLQALPCALTQRQCSTGRQLEGTLQVHVEKKVTFCVALM